MSETTAPILITSDLSPRSDRAIARGLALARQLGAPAIVFSAIDAALPEDMAADMAERARARLSEQTASLAGNGTDITIKTQVGDPCEDIIALVEQLKPRLLVMGTHRRRAFLDILRETTMQRIVRRTDCAALLVTDPADVPYQRVVVATDFSPAAAVVLRIGRTLSADDAPVQLIHALQIPYAGRIARSPELMSQMETSFRKDAAASDAAWRDTHDLTDLPPTDIVTTPILAALDTAPEGTKHTLIAVGAHGRVGAHRSVLGSVAVDLLRSPPCDVLVARPTTPH